MRRLVLPFAALFFAIGVAALALTFYLWFGDWPRQQRPLIEHLRSAAENAGRPPDPLIENAEARSHRSLGGRWQAVIDPYGRAGLMGQAPLASEPRTPSDLGEFSFEKGLELDVPGDWNSQDPRLVFYQGIVWYKRTFDWQPDSAPGAARQFLYFGAANYSTAVYLNGRLLGEHEGGFTPFNFEVTSQLRPGENLLVVRVDNRKGGEDVPTATTDWHNYGGLTRDVLLISLPDVFVRAYEIQLAGHDGDAIRGWVRLDGAAPGDTASVAIPELDVAVTAEVDASGRAGIEIEARPRLWSPRSPQLYRVSVTAGDDSVSDRIGFRIVETAGGEILLNGDPIFLRGISIHEEAPFGGGRVHSKRDAATLLGWARELNCNFVRLAHYPHNEHMARLADEMGLLVWAEIPVYWNVAFESPLALERARRQLSELIDRDHNRASVIFWSIGNETPNSPARQRFMGALADHVRQRDPSRLLTAALLSDGSSLGPFFGGYYVPAVFGVLRDVWRYRVTDPLGQIADVPALNQYFGWYYSGAIGLITPLSSARARRIILDNMERIRIETGLGKPLVISEFGAGARAGMHAPEEELAVYSEEYQALVYRKQLAMLSDQPEVRGLSPWVLQDFRSPMRLYQGVQDYWNRKGLVSDDGKKKQAFFVLRDYYADLERNERERERSEPSKRRST